MKTSSDIKYLETLIKIIKNHNIADSVLRKIGILNLNLQQVLSEGLRSNSSDYIHLTYLINEAGLSVNFVQDLNVYIESIIVRQFKSEAEIYSEFLEFTIEDREANLFFKKKVEKGLDSKKNHYPEVYLPQYKLFTNDASMYHSKSKKTDIKFYDSLLCNFIFEQLHSIICYYTESHLYNVNSEVLESEFKRLNAIIDIYKIDTIEIKSLLELIHFLRESSLEGYYSIRSLIFSKKLELRDLDIRTFFISMMNILVVNQHSWGIKDVNLLQNYLEFYTSYETVFLKYLNPQTIKNIATICIRSYKTEEFYKLFTEAVSKKFSVENKLALEFANIKIIFSLKKYGDCLEKLNNFQTNDIFQELEFRRIQVMCFYELKERVLVDNYLNTFKVFIHRNDTINKTYKDSNNHFIRLLNRLNTTIYLGKLEKIQQDFDKMERVAEKQWIQDKITELKTKLENERRS